MRAAEEERTGSAPVAGVQVVSYGIQRCTAKKKRHRAMLELRRGGGEEGRKG